MESNLNSKSYDRQKMVTFFDKIYAPYVYLMMEALKGTNYHIRAKPHRVSHLGDSILKYGPVNGWDTLPTERAYGTVGSAMQSNRNFTNVAFTSAKNSIKYFLCSLLTHEPPYITTSKEMIQLTLGDPLMTRFLKERTFNGFIENLMHNEDIYSMKKVQFLRRHTFEVGLLYVIGTTMQCNPRFLKITDILLRKRIHSEPCNEDQFLLLGEVFDVDSFNRTFYAYKMKPSIKLISLVASENQDYMSFNIFSKKGQNYVPKLADYY